jgi:hypothetical protein
LERRDPVKDLKKGYGLRSQFVHHGKEPADIGVANRVIKACWLAVNKALQLTQTFETKDALLHYLDRRILS